MDNDPTKLTSFQPLTPVVLSSGFSLSRFFGKRKTSRAPKLTATPEQSRKKCEQKDAGASVASNTTPAKSEVKHEKVILVCLC